MHGDGHDIWDRQKHGRFLADYDDNKLRGDDAENSNGSPQITIYRMSDACVHVWPPLTFGARPVRWSTICRTLSEPPPSWLPSGTGRSAAVVPRCRHHHHCRCLHCCCHRCRCLQRCHFHRSNYPSAKRVPRKSQSSTGVPRFWIFCPLWANNIVNS